MQIQASFVPSDLSELQPLREEYLNQLSEAQEASIEVLVPGAACFAIEVDAESSAQPSGEKVRCGYFIVHEQSTLIELHLTRPYWVFGQCIFTQILADTPVERALVKSFDHLLLSSCIAAHTSLRVKGLLVRDIVPRAPAGETLPVRQRVASLADLPAILAVDQQVFRHPERLRMVITAGHMQLFEAEGVLVGFGIVRPVIPGREHVELGIAVDKPYRLKGFSAQLFRSLIDDCLARGLVPIAGVAVENVASRSMGERAGMVARHRLLELGFG